MDWDSGLTVALGLGSLIVGATSLSHTLKSNRGKKYLDNLEGLHKTEELFRSWGALEGPDASRLSKDVHEKTLTALNREKRLNAVFYLETVSRLSRPGSYGGALPILYAAIMCVPVFNGTFPIGQPMSESDRQGVVIALMLWLFVVLALGSVGYRQIWRRLKTRKLVKNMGLVDPVSVEGINRRVSDVRELLQR